MAEEIDTGFIEARLDELIVPPPPFASMLTSAALEFARLDRRPGDVGDPWSSLEGAAGFRLNAHVRSESRLRVGGKPYVAHFEHRVSGHRSANPPLLCDDGQLVMFQGGETYLVSRDLVDASVLGSASPMDGKLSSPMPGRIVSVAVTVGAKVVKGQVVVVLEAMKMEHAMTAPFDGYVVDIRVDPGDQVSESVLLAELKRLD